MLVVNSRKCLRSLSFFLNILAEEAYTPETGQILSQFMANMFRQIRSWMKKIRCRGKIGQECLYFLSMPMY